MDKSCAKVVCHDVFHAISGSYFLRIYGFFYQLTHLTGFSKRVREHLLARDREHMTQDELRASRKRERAVSRKIFCLTMPRLLKALSPFYTPRKAKEPRMLRSYMAEVEGRLK